MKNISSPCQAHDNQTYIAKIDGEKWRVELIEKVIEPLTALEWYENFQKDNKTFFEEMEEYASYRLEFYKKHGI